MQMTWRRFASLIEWVRHPATVILAIVIAFQRTMAFRSSSYIEPSMRMLSRHFMFWGAICLVLFAVAFTALLVLVETRAKRDEERERIPEARIRDRAVTVEPVAREAVATPVRAAVAPTAAPIAARVAARVAAPIVAPPPAP